MNKTKIIIALAVAGAANGLFPCEGIVRPETAFAAREREIVKGKRGERFANKVDDTAQKRIEEIGAEIFAPAGVPAEDVQTLQSFHYLVLTNCPQMDRRYADALEKVYDFVKKEFDFVPAPGYLYAVVFQNQAQYTAFLGNKLKVPPVDARSTGGVTFGEVYVTFQNDNLLKTLAHEAAHQLVGTRLKIEGGGSWLQEGLAVYIEKRFEGRNPSTNIKGRIDQDRYYYFEDFLKLNTLLFDPKGYGVLNYEQAGSMIDFMLNGRYRSSFKAYLQLVRANPSPDAHAATQAIETAYKMNLYRFENAWRQFCGSQARTKMPGEK